jgi:hypothetical protein
VPEKEREGEKDKINDTIEVYYQINVAFVLDGNFKGCKIKYIMI